MRTFSATLTLLALPLCATAQNGVNSPYSRYGFGTMADRAQGFNKGMGGVAQGFRNGQQINASNPASYSAIDSLTALFDIGLTLTNGNFKMGELQQNARNTSFDYFAFQFRALKGFGVTLGILPYTNINYNFSSSSEKIENSENITSSYSFTGDGGLHQVFLGAGIKVLEPLSVGMNASYLYGDYTHTSTMAFNQTSAYSVVRGYTANISTYKLDFGFQYTMALNAKDKITLGGTYGLGHDVSNRAIRYTETMSSSAVQGITSDTIANAFQLPHTLDIGLTYTHSDKWRVGSDFQLEKWSKVKFPAQDITTNRYASTAGQLNDRVKVALGGDYTPNPRSPKYRNHITYKFGGYYAKSYANASALTPDKPCEYGVSAGLSVPISNRYIWYNTPRVNLSLQWVHTNIPYVNNITAQADKLTENYLKLSVGLTFSERWFNKWKVR